ncbi:hypothetical protein E4T52_03192 [Aureobasidium sp. EXF-3400]|nr:hypothetical protein E4T51_02281 [Aureobasidium sp. EXF-12344]KAI4781864.1 hypothetical protein E4T52_03192 [Aureobasidium sp. EXF-3400]
MADYNEEEDLFADLYEGDDAAPSAPAPAAPAPAPTTVETAAAEQSDSIAVSSEQPPQSEPIANGSNAPAEPQSYSNDGWNDQQQQGQQTWDYNNQNQGNDYGAPQQMNHGGGGDEDYKPIGIKEDGKYYNHQDMMRTGVSWNSYFSRPSALAGR